MEYVDVDVEWMYELRQSPLCPPQTYDLHSTKQYLLIVIVIVPELIKSILKYISSISRHNMIA